MKGTFKRSQICKEGTIQDHSLKENETISKWTLNKEIFSKAMIFWLVARPLAFG